MLFNDASAKVANVTVNILPYKVQYMEGGAQSQERVWQLQHLLMIGSVDIYELVMYLSTHTAQQELRR